MRSSWLQRNHSFGIRYRSHSMIRDGFSLSKMGTIQRARKTGGSRCQESSCCRMRTATVRWTSGSCLLNTCISLTASCRGKMDCWWVHTIWWRNGWSLFSVASTTTPSGLAADRSNYCTEFRRLIHHVVTSTRPVDAQTQINPDHCDRAMSRPTSVGLAVSQVALNPMCRASECRVERAVRPGSHRCQWIGKAGEQIARAVFHDPAEIQIPACRSSSGTG